MVSVASWCRACGVPTEGVSTACARCGTPLDESDPGLARIGLVAVVEWRRARHLGVVVHELARSVHLLVAGRNTVEMSLDAFDAATAEVPGPRSPAWPACGRLSWPSPRTTSPSATMSIGARRAAARDALALGTPQVIGGLDLPMLEAYWYQAWAAAAAADTPGLLGWLERLPPAGLPGAGPADGTRRRLIRDHALGARAAAQLAPFTTADPDVRAWHAVLATEPADTIAVLGGLPGRQWGRGRTCRPGSRGTGRPARGHGHGLRVPAGGGARGGTDLADRAGRLTRDRAEALNIAAFRQGGLGDAAAALRTLEAALEGEPAMSPSGTGCWLTRALSRSPRDHRARCRISRGSPDPSRVRRCVGCVRPGDRSVDGDADSQEYPGTLRAILHALAARQDDEFHWRLLRLADVADTTWLALEARPRSVNEDQAGAERYGATWARAKTDGCQEDLSDVAAALGEAARRRAARTGARGVALLRRTARRGRTRRVRCGGPLAPANEALLDAGVLDLDQRLVLAAQAGAHIAASAAGYDGVIAPEYERRLLFEVAAEYGGRRAELAETVRNYVGGELASA